MYLKIVEWLKRRPGKITATASWNPGKAIVGMRSNTRNKITRMTWATVGVFSLAAIHFLPGRADAGSMLSGTVQTSNQMEMNPVTISWTQTSGANTPLVMGVLTIGLKTPTQTGFFKINGVRSTVSFTQFNITYNLDVTSSGVVTLTGGSVNIFEKTSSTPLLIESSSQLLDYSVSLQNNTGIIKTAFSTAGSAFYAGPAQPDVLLTLAYPGGTTPPIDGMLLYKTAFISPDTYTGYKIDMNPVAPNAAPLPSSLAAGAIGVAGVAAMGLFGKRLRRRQPGC